MTRIVKKRRQRRAEKLMRRKRAVTVMLILAVVMLLPQMVNLAIAERLDRRVITVVVSAGDSVWSIARENAAEDTNIRRLVHKIIDENSIVNGNIYAGQELVIPLD